MPNTDPPAAAAAPAPIRVATVEDDAASRIALVAALNAAGDMRLLWAASARTEALATLARPDAEPPDVLLVDLGLPDGSGLEVIAAARRRWPACAPMVCTIFGDEEHVLAAIEAGAMGYLLKDATPEVVVQDELRGGVLVKVGRSTMLQENFYAITTSRRFPNPLLRDLLDRRRPRPGG